MGDAAEPVRAKRRAGTWRPLIALGLLALIFAAIVFGRQLLALFPQPAAVAERTSVPSCGTEQATHSGGWNIAARTCFWTAYLQGRPAEFISTRPTIEGAPITSIFRVIEPGRVEVIIDSRQDPYSNRGWTYLQCPRLIPLEGQPQPDFGWGDDCVALPID